MTLTVHTLAGWKLGALARLVGVRGRSGTHVISSKLEELKQKDAFM